MRETIEKYICEHIWGILLPAAGISIAVFWVVPPDKSLPKAMSLVGVWVVLGVLWLDYCLYQKIRNGRNSKPIAKILKLLSGFILSMFMLNLLLVAAFGGDILSCGEKTLREEIFAAPISEVCAPQENPQEVEEPVPQTEYHIVVEPVEQKRPIPQVGNVDTEGGKLCCAKLQMLFALLYYTVMTFTTIGYGDISPVLGQGLVNILVMFVAGVTSLLGMFSTAVVVGELMSERPEQTILE